MNSLEGFSYLQIAEALEIGSEQGHGEGWKEKKPLFHYGKAIRHATTHILEITGMLTPSGENHAKLALCRMAMGLYVEKGGGKT